MKPTIMLYMPEYIWSHLSRLAKMYECSKSAVVGAILVSTKNGNGVNTNPHDVLPKVAHYGSSFHKFRFGGSPMKKRTSKVTLPREVFPWIEEEAEKRNTTVQDLARTYIKMATPEWSETP